MSFVTEYPVIADLLGGKLKSLPDKHAQELSGRSDEEAVEHFKTCQVAEWCSLYSSGMDRPDDKLDLVEWTLASLLSSSLPKTKVFSAYQRKVRDSTQFYQLIGELAVAASCHLRAILVDLEWKTGKSNKDADVRGEFAGTPANIEVTLRTDPWVQKIAFHAEDYLDSEGRLLGDVPAPKERSLLTKEEREDYEKMGLKLPKREVQPGEPTPEPKKILDMLQEKAVKFNPDGFHVVALCTPRAGLPSESHVQYAVYGSSSLLPTGGLFSDQTYEQVCAVLYVDVFHHLWRLQGLSQGRRPKIPKRNALFLNPFAAHPLNYRVRLAISKAFEAAVRKAPQPPKWKPKGTGETQ